MPAGRRKKQFLRTQMGLRIKQKQKENKVNVTGSARNKLVMP